MKSCAPPELWMCGDPGKGGLAAVLWGVQKFCPSRTQGGQNPGGLCFRSNRTGRQDGMADAAAPSPAALVRSSRLCSCVFGTAVSRAEGGFSLPGVLGGDLKTHTGLGPVSGTGHLLRTFATILCSRFSLWKTQGCPSWNSSWGSVSPSSRMLQADSQRYPYTVCWLLYPGSHHPITT